MTLDMLARDSADLAHRRLRRLFPRTQPSPIAAFLGDSLTDWADNSSSTASTSIVQWTAISYVNYLRRLLRGRLATDRSLVLGVAGVGTSHLLSTQVPAAIAAGVDIAFIQIGTNDIGVLTAQQIVANVTSAVQALNAAGIGVVLISVAPQSAWTVAKRRDAAEVNRGYWKLASGRTGTCRFIDINYVYVDHGTGNALTGYQYNDNVHDSPVGSYAKAQRIAAAVDDLFPRIPELLDFGTASNYDATLAPNGNLLTNGVFTGTTGPKGTNATGSVATGWRIGTLGASTMTVAGSKGTDANNSSLPTQILTLGGTGDSTVIRCVAAPDNININLACPSGFVAGDKLVAEMEVSWTGLGTAIKGIELVAEAYQSAFTTTATDGSHFTPSGTGDMPLPPAMSSVIFQTPPLVLPDPATLLPLGLGVILRITPISGATLGGTITMARACLRRA